MTADEYIKKEMSIWGEDYVYDLIERDYYPVEVVDAATGLTKWTWILKVRVRPQHNLVNV